MGHCLALRIYQPPGDVLEPKEPNSCQQEPGSKANPYKLESVHIPTGLNEFVDVPFYHPLRYHRELVVTHCRTQQWQHVRMTKGFPRHNLLAEPLHRLVSSPTRVIRKVVQTPRACNFPEIAGRVYPQNLDRDLATLVIAHPHVREPATVQRDI